MTGPTKLVVSDADAQRRIDTFLASALDVSVHRARRLLDDGLVTCEMPATSSQRKGLKKGDRVTSGMVLQIAGAPSGEVVVPQEGPLVVLALEADLIALEKPPGVALHPLRAGETNTVANWLVARFPSCAGASEDTREAGFIHRLDVATGGLVLAARSREAWIAWRAVLGRGDCEKQYLADVAGEPADRWTEDTPIGRRGRHGTTVQLDGGRGVLPAVTSFETLRRRPGAALVSARLRHGRAHQVRAHLAGSGHPILGDDRYGTPASQAVSVAEGADGLRLWAHVLEALDPVTGSRRRWEAPAPAWGRC